MARERELLRWSGYGPKDKNEKRYTNGMVVYSRDLEASGRSN